ncbi:hypothetical protein KBD49_13000 [Myxococcota bacterium]|nr:hypothetical protein [Myxococcota bacterium]
MLRTPRMFPSSRMLLAGIAALCVACGAGTGTPDPGSGSPEVPDPGTPVDVPPGDPPAETDDGTPVPETTWFVHVQDRDRTGLATGEYARPGLEYPPVPVDPAFRHVLSFQMTPMMPPLRKGEPSNGPLILYGDDLETLVFSPADHFFESVIWMQDGRIHYGVAGEIDALPRGFTHRFVLVRGRGIQATVAAWGDLMRREHGRERADRYADAGVATLGYWTDNGAAYYYTTAPGLNEQDTLLAVQADADARGIPYGYLQLDSWWYFKDPGFGLLAGGLVEWQPRPEMFPDGLAAFRQRLGLPLITHNRWFAPQNAYRDRYEFVDGPAMSFPTSGDLFEEFAADARSWGVITYEQDWLINQYWGVPWLREAPGRAADWMGWIDQAARGHGLSVQICMPGPAHLLDALDRPATLTVRTSADHMTPFAKEAFWPAFHIVNLVADAVGLLPFKDNFLTREFRAEGEALISALSAAMVGIGDPVGEADPVLIARTCRKDGVLLKPDRPALPLDFTFLPGSRPYAVRTWSDRGDLGRWTYLAAFNLGLEHPDRTDEDRMWSLLVYDALPLDEMYPLPDLVSDWHVDLREDLGIEGPVVAWDWRGGTATVVRDRLDLPPAEGFADHAYVVLAPVLPNGLALIGETGKFVTLADRRFTAIEVQPDAVRVTLAGMPGEDVELRAYDVRGGRLLPPVAARIGQDGTATATLAR